jgi:hypothetical protein
MSTLARPWLITRSLCLVLVCATAACAPAPAPGAGAKHGALDAITEDELADPALAGSSLADAILRLRPRFLNKRGAGLRATSESVHISYNGSEPGPTSDLSRIDISDVAEVRYLSTADASLRFGGKGTMGPVLLITTKRR